MEPAQKEVKWTNVTTPSPSVAAWTGPRFDDRRDSERQPSEGDVWLVDAEGMKVVRCHTHDAGDSGFRGVVPIGYGLAVGQRFELRSGVSPDLRDDAGHRSERRFGTIVRTELVTNGSQYHLAFAIRYDKPMTFRH
ncbi:MAG: hypothetical protein L6Q92_11105 [Phycisphaerae bacterium]|nr:hypothetical protein [Phycisphaerae bacterium]